MSPSGPGLSERDLIVAGNGLDVGGDDLDAFHYRNLILAAERPLVRIPPPT